LGARAKDSSPLLEIVIDSGKKESVTEESMKSSGRGGGKCPGGRSGQRDCAVQLAGGAVREDSSEVTSRGGGG